MAATVATPLERALGRIAGVTEMTSSSSLGSTRITLQFDLSRDIDGAARDVQAAINAARSLLPTGLPSNPTYRKVNPADAPIMILALTSDDADARPDVRRRLDDPGAEAAAGRGRRRRERRRQLAAGGARRAQSARSSTGTASASKTVRTAHRRHQRQPAEGLRGRRRPSLADPRQRPGAEGGRLPAADHRLSQRRRRSGCATSPTSPIRWRTCATPALSNGKPAVLLVIFRQPDANIIETVDGVKRAAAASAASIPERHRPRRRDGPHRRRSAPRCTRSSAR